VKGHSTEKCKGVRPGWFHYDPKKSGERKVVQIAQDMHKDVHKDVQEGEVYVTRNLVHNDDTMFIIDSDATHHVVNDINLHTNIKRSKK
jgi:hypothetical protein